jgi:hypothetical protein
MSGNKAVQPVGHTLTFHLRQARACYQSRLPLLKIDQPMTTHCIRPASLADIPAITAIYRPAVLTGFATFEIYPPDEAEMARRFNSITAAGYPYLVAEVDGRIGGYA